MNTPNDGGAAFPSLKMITGPNRDVPVMMGGMSLRDYFAGQVAIGLALASSIANAPLLDEAQIAGAAYTIADALLTKRAEP